LLRVCAHGLDLTVRHGINGSIGGGAATMDEDPIQGYREAAARAGQDLKLGENLCLGIFFYLADSRERAIREMTPLYEEHVKMFAPLGFVPGIKPPQIEAAARRGGGGAPRGPTPRALLKTGGRVAGTAAGGAAPPPGLQA